MSVRPPHAIEESLSIFAVNRVGCNRLTHIDYAPVYMQHLADELIADKRAVQLEMPIVAGNIVVALLPFVSAKKQVMHHPSFLLKCLANKYKV